MATITIPSSAFIQNTPPLKIGETVFFKKKKRIIGIVSKAYFDNRIAGTFNSTIKLFYSPSPKSQLKTKNRLSKNKRPLLNPTKQL